MERTSRIFWAIISITLVIISAAYLISNFTIKPRPPLTPVPPVYSTTTPLPTPTQPTMPTVMPTDVSTLEPTSIPTPTKSSPQHQITILLDDFRPQPYPGETVYPFNRLGGERGAVNNSVLYWGTGHATSAIAAGQSWAVSLLALITLS